VATVNSEILAGRQDDGVSKRFGHANEAVRVVLLYEAEMLAKAGKRTMDVFTVKVALVAPDGTVTLEGTLATELLLERAACAPPEGAGPFALLCPLRTARRR